MNTFSDDLFDDLMREHGAALLEIDRPAPPGRRVGRPLWVTSGALAATGAAALGFVVFGGGGPAYAVTESPDGTVTVSVSDPSGIAGANSALNGLGVRVVVVPVGSDCPSVQSIPHVSMKGLDLVTRGAARNKDGSVSVKVTGVPAGDTVLMAFEQVPGGGSLGVSGIIEGKAPSCVSLPSSATTLPSGGASVAPTGEGGGTSAP